MKIAVVTDKSRAEILHNEEGFLEDSFKEAVGKAVMKALKSRYDVIRIPFDQNLVERIRKEKVDFVFNLCNGIEGASRLSQLPSLLEKNGIPYTGSGPLPHSIAYNKIFSGKALQAASIPTPGFFTCTKVEELSAMDLTYPLLVKPKNEGSSRGIREDSLVHNFKDLTKKVKHLLAHYDPPALINEYIDGKEFTVGVLGNGQELLTLPVMGIDFSNLPEKFSRFYSFEVKHHYDDYVRFQIPAEVERHVEEEIRATAEAAFKALGLRDYARIDMRVVDGKPYVIEVNSLPGLHREISDLVKMAKVIGIGYEDLILHIVDSAKRRYEHLSGGDYKSTDVPAV